MNRQSVAGAEGADKHAALPEAAMQVCSIIESNLTWKRGCPANWPPLWLMSPSSVNRLMVASLWRWPEAKSLGSWAGVIFTAPVPKAMSTSSGSWMTGIFRLSRGCSRNLPW